MLYLLETYALVAIVVFSLAGIFLLGFAVFNAVRQYALALRAMRRAASGARHEPFANSRTISRSRGIRATNAS